MRAVLGLGGNLGDRAGNLQAALDALAHLPGTAVTAVSSIYETAPVGYADQPDFYNLVAVVETELSPHALLGGCLGIEAALGRVRTFRNAPRVVDIDVLLVEGYTSADPELTLPHPRMMERAFVLVPLKELFPERIALGVLFPDAVSDDVRLTSATVKL
jgi:2-amino-4-hydroxy-6-hydroxymethyldihydropteridine diphosphokinase